MHPSHPLALLHLPDALLVALTSRELHFQMQPFHFLVRLVHVVAAAGFFGAIVLLDLGLVAGRAAARLRPVAELAAPWLYGSFATTLASGVLLFLYDPLRVGSHAYFTPKMALLALGLANAAAFHRAGYPRALLAAPVLPARARLAGAVSLGLWLGVMACASLNAEAVPKVLLR